jgi:Fe-S cluster assembly ATPase SufC
MLVTVSVYGIPKRIKATKLERFSSALLKVVSTFHKKKDSIICLFPYDKLMEYTQKIVIIIEGTTINQEDEEFKKQLSNEVDNAFPDSSSTWCFIRE